MTGKLVTPIQVQAAMDLGSKQYMLRFVQQQLPPAHEVTTRDVVSGRTKLHVPGVSNPSLDAFLAEYTNCPGFSMPYHFSYFSTGRFANKVVVLSDAIRRFVEHARCDIATSVVDLPQDVITKFTDCEFVPTTQDLFLAGAAIAQLSLLDEMINQHGADGGGLRSYQTSARTCYDSIARKMLPLHIDLLPSLFFVSEVEEGTGPEMEVGRRSSVDPDDKEFSRGEEVHRLLNPIVPERGRWYNIPPVPFAVYPGISGWRIRQSLSEEIDGELAEVLARGDRSSISEEKIDRHVKMRSVVSPDAEGVFRYPIRGCCKEDLALEHVAVSSKAYPAINIEVSGSMAFIIPLLGQLAVKSTTVRSSRVDQYTYTVEPGGGVVLLSSGNDGDIDVSFSVRALERSSFLVFQPELLRCMGSARPTCKERTLEGQKQ